MSRSYPFNPLLLIVLCVFILLTWPVWQWLWREWMGNDYYSHGLLILPTALFLAIQRLRLHKQPLTTDTSSAEKPLPTKLSAFTPSISGVSLLLSVVIYLIFLNYKAYYLAAFAMIAMIGAIVWSLGTVRLLRLWRFPIGYLLLMVPLPFVERLTYPMAIFAGLCGGELVRLFGMDLQIVGNAVTLPNAELVIGAQCSGINSLIALLALTILASYVLTGPWWGRLILVLASIPLAIMGNILRITSLIFIARSYGAQAGFVFYHDYSGIIFFICILLLMLPLMRLLQVNRLRMDVI